MLDWARHAIPTRIRHKDGDAVVLSYEQYQRLLAKSPKSKKDQHDLVPLLRGKILKPLDESTDKALLDHMGL